MGFDPIQYKVTTRQQWEDAADAWHRWGPVLEQWLGQATETMLDAAGVHLGSRVLDVAAGAGGHLETIGQVADAALYEPGDAASAAAQLRRLAGDADLRRDYGERLRAVQRRLFTVERQADAVLVVLAQVGDGTACRTYVRNGDHRVLGPGSTSKV